MLKQSVFDRIRLSNLERHLGLYGIHLYHDGEEAWFQFQSEERLNLHSASKTFLSVAVGICVDEKKLSLSDSALSYFPEFQECASAGSEKITLRDLLHMSSGKENFWFSVTEKQYADWAGLFWKDPMKSEPGTKFYYSNACTYLLGRIVEKVTGKNVRDFLMPLLFGPLEIFNPQWNCCPMGHPLCATGLQLTTGELAKMGRLLLQKGNWEGRQIVSEAYVEQLQFDCISTKERFEEPENAQGYGYQVWRCAYPGAYRLDGKYGQYSIVVPDKNAVVTITAHNEKNCGDIIRTAFRDVIEEL